MKGDQVIIREEISSSSIEISVLSEDDEDKNIK